jgi:peptidyl-prolyl cis-trans isomerase B (cyclophilin B)
MPTRRLVLPMLCVVLLVAGCGGGHKAAKPAPRAPETLKPPVAQLDASKHWTLTFATDRGTFVVALEPRISPRATASLVALARRGYFDNTIFHRIVPGFVIQGGDPTQSGQGGPGYTTIDPPPSGTRYLKGVVAMAKTGAEPRGAAGSQFFVMTADAPSLPPDYAVVGRVTSGMSVVEKIGELGDSQDPNGTPRQTVVVQQVTVASR